MSELQNAEIRWLESGQPFSEKFDDVYSSKYGGIEESDYVFLESSELKQRWRLPPNGSTIFTIAELGFGTGLNFLLCWRLWQQLNPPRRRLHYIAFENFPLTVKDLQQALNQWPELSEFSKQLISIYPDHSAGIHRLQIADEVVLDIYYGDAIECLSRRHSNFDSQIDCWFMDGFSPKKNPSMWSDELVQLMSLHSGPGTTVSTYSAAGFVRRNLSAAGFEVTKKPGFGGKREMLVATLVDGAVKDSPVSERLNSRKHKPWFLVPASKSKKKTAIIIGAGFAGSSTANSLARRGWTVTLIDSAANIASGASGNKQAVLQCRLAADLTPQSRFYLQSYLYTQRQFSQLKERHPLNWHNCGVLMLTTGAESRLSRLQESLEQFYGEAVVTRLSQQQAGAVAGATVNSDALWLPHGGWLDPRALCKAYLDEETSGSIKLVTSTPIDSLIQTDGGWLVKEGELEIASADIVILANSHEAAQYQQTRHLPLIPVRGQISHIKSNSQFEKLASVVIADGYICPSSGDSHTIGATYETGESNCQIRDADNEENLLALNSAFESSDLKNLEIAESRAAVRCNTPDYFPVVGTVPDYQNFQQQYAILARNAKAKVENKADYFKGLYINSGHGSYGLATCPLSAEYLASLIDNESLPLSMDVMDALSPARFIIRDLMKQRIIAKK